MDRKRLMPAYISHSQCSFSKGKMCFSWIRNAEFGRRIMESSEFMFCRKRMESDELVCYRLTKSWIERFNRSYTRGAELWGKPRQLSRRCTMRLFPLAHSIVFWSWLGWNITGRWNSWKSRWCVETCWHWRFRWMGSAYGQIQRDYQYSIWSTNWNQASSKKFDLNVVFINRTCKNAAASYWKGEWD